jgi:hypothetical protein
VRQNFMAAEVTHLMAHRKWMKRKGLGTRYNLQKHASLGRPCLLKFPELLKIAPPVGDQIFNT